MAEFGDPIPHTGGVLTIHKRDRRYQLNYQHMNAHAAGLVELIAVSGKPVAGVDIGGVSLQDDQVLDPELMIMLPTDSEAMYGRQCPVCNSYFRTSHPYTSTCPYCFGLRPGLQFFTEAQLRFIDRQYKAILAALEGPDGDTRVDFDAQSAEPASTHSWVYAETRQQRHFRCPQCELKFDVLGDYVLCPACRRSTAREVLQEKFRLLSSSFEADAQQINKDGEGRELRRQRWRQYLLSAVSEFEALGRHIAQRLSLIPATSSRRRALRELSFQNLLGAADNLERWFDIDAMRGVSAEDRAFLHRIFHRRHLHTHTGGRVDQEYLDKTGDSSVRLHEVVPIRSAETRRVLNLLPTICGNLLDGLESISDDPANQ